MPEVHEAQPLDDISDRFPPLDKEALPHEQREVYERIEQRRGRMPAPYTALLGSPGVAEAFEQLSSKLQSGALPPIVLEAVFLMTARQHRCRYLWINHVDKARNAGLDEDGTAALGRGAIPRGPSAVTAAIRFQHFLVTEHRVPQPVYDSAVAELSPRGVVDLMAFCGFASSVAMLLNVRQPDLPAGRTAPF